MNIKLKRFYYGAGRGSWEQKIYNDNTISALEYLNLEKVYGRKIHNFINIFNKQNEYNEYFSTIFL